MQQWDYTTRVLTGGFMGRHKDVLNRPPFEQELDELGREGWKLTHILIEQSLHGEKDGPRDDLPTAARSRRLSKLAAASVDPVVGGVGRRRALAPARAGADGRT